MKMENIIVVGDGAGGIEMGNDGGIVSLYREVTGAADYHGRADAVGAFLEAKGNGLSVTGEPVDDGLQKLCTVGIGVGEKAEIGQIEEFGHGDPPVVFFHYSTAA